MSENIFQLQGLEHARIPSGQFYHPSKLMIILTRMQSELISENLVIFVVSTTGSGTEPRSMTPLWQQLLRSDLPTDLFEDLIFACFGLGDSSYEKFCWPSKLLARRMESLGGSQICKRGEGDDQDRLGCVDLVVYRSIFKLDSDARILG
jgi:sulfite reductase alpha subunit-like flavoprotein